MGFVAGGDFCLIQALQRFSENFIIIIMVFFRIKKIGVFLMLCLLGEKRG